jgi:uncharacterized protein
MKTALLFTALAALACSKTPPEPAAGLVRDEGRARPTPSAETWFPTSSAPPNANPNPTASLVRDEGRAGLVRDEGRAGPKTCPLDPAPEKFKPTVHALAFEKGPNVSIELVTTSEDTAHGLMYRRSMPESAGMLFKMKNEVHTFWMHNTCMALDMLFLDENGVVLGLLEEVPPMNDEIRTINQPSVYVLEMNAGYSRKNQIKTGSKLLLNSAIRTQKVP